MSSLRKFGVAVVGLGRIGAIHVKDLRISGRASIKFLVEEDVAKAEKMAEVFETPPQCLHLSNMDRMLKDESVEGVFICTPTTFHEIQIKQALNNGKAVFCEKPLTNSIQSTISCYELAESTGRPLFCAFHRRFDPSFSRVKESIHAMGSGGLRMLRFSSHDPSPPPASYIETSGGIINDSTIHDLDLALWMTESPAKSVYVQGQTFSADVKACGDHDLVVIIVTHENGAVSVIDNGRRCAYGYDQRVEAMCEDASFIVSNRPTHQTFQHRPDHAEMPEIDQVFTTRYTQAYTTEVDHFLDAMAGAPLKVTKSDTISAMMLVEAAIKSLKTGVKVEL